jgi:alpha-glucosidase
MQLAAFSPFFRNHNVLGAISQEPYVWDSVAEASRIAIKARTSCSLLGRHSSPLLTSMVLPSSTREPHSSCRRGGTDAIDRSLFFVYPNDASLLAVSSQYLVGDSILVTPVLTPNVTTVTGLFPEGRTTIWRDWFTHKVRSLALRSV